MLLITLAQVSRDPGHIILLNVSLVNPLVKALIVCQQATVDRPGLALMANELKHYPRA
jgi:hypothetical protein